LKYRFILFAIFGAGALALLSLIGVQRFNATMDRTVTDQAERHSLAWARYIGDHLTRIEMLASGSPPTEEERRFLQSARGFGDIFRFKVYDPQGVLRLLSDYLNSRITMPAARDEDSIYPLRVTATGEPFIRLMDGRHRVDRPDVYVEAYIPIRRNERIVAVAEVYIDRTAEAQALRHDFLTFGWQATGLVILALCIPGAAALWAFGKLRQHNRMLDDEGKRAREAERSKGRFLAHISHEFRTPLNSIQGLAQVLLRGDVGPLENAKHREYVHDIHDSGRHLLSLVNDLLDLSKIDFGKYELLESDFDIGKCVHGALQVVKGWEAAGALHLGTRGLNTGLFVHADRRAIYQSVLNLLANAVKFTPPAGSIDLSISMDGDECLITVSDTGVGIAEQDLPRVFEPFMHEDDRDYISPRRGTGLGLALVKSLIDLHGGHITIDSTPGKGTTVRVFLPKARIINPPRPATGL
tara:strand:- start:635 stop:2038 length:1404 start_codon:yes stop_codon:yes gene_type:complete